MGTQEMPPGSGIPVHKHDRTEEILHVSEGSGTLVLGDQRISVERDTTIWVPPGTWHGVENSDEHMHIIGFVSPAGLDELFRGMFWKPGQPPKTLSPEEIRDLERQHDSVARQ
jgi:quercetin dioxygenase-like cupin family protein